MTFAKWLDTFLSEKGIDTEEVLEVEGPIQVGCVRGQLNMIPVGCLVDAMKGAPMTEQRAIRTLLVQVDFRNGDVRHCLTHLAQAIAA